MKKSVRYIVMSLVLLLGVSAPKAFAGNEDRSGQAGAPELLINPWAASAGWGNAGMSFVKGVEAMFGNVAGISAIRSLDVNFSHTDWLKGSDVKISSFGLAVRVGESSVLGLSFFSLNPGSIMETTTENPDGGIGTFKPNLMNINVAFAKTFSNSISGGFNLKIISESIANMGAVGVALDAGIQYVTGPFDNIHFGITLKNIGPVKRVGRGGKKVYDAIFPQISTYWARHSWATIAASLDIPRDTIAHALGHGGNTVTDIYIDFDQSKVDKANRKILDWVLYGKK